MAEDTEEDWFERALDADETEEPSEEKPREEDDGDSSEPEDRAASGEGSPDETGESTRDEEFGTAGDGLDIDVSDEETFGFDLDSEESELGEEGTELGDEEYHTDIPRIDVGIDGLDAMIQEGVPERSLMAVIGGAGTGKTTFGLQFLQEALAAGDRAVFITLEESRERILTSASQKGWDFEAAAEAGDLAVLDLDPVDMANSLTSIRSELPRLVGDFGADRLALDSVSLLEMMYDDQATRRTEIYDFANALKQAGVTTLVTSEAASDTAYSSRFGIIEYLTDAVFVLQYVRPEDFQETRLAVEIQKIRDANHSRESKPYEITSDGLTVYRDAAIF
ncbi:MAG: KaiC domain-containing protein [Halodesulfurarchaeum sp.]